MHIRVKVHEAHGHGVGEAGGQGYSGLLKYAVHDAYRPCQTIRSALEPLFLCFRQIV